MSPTVEGSGSRERKLALVFLVLAGMRGGSYSLKGTPSSVGCGACFNLFLLICWRHSWFAYIGKNALNK